MEKVLNDRYTKEKTISILRDYFKTDDLDLIFTKIITKFLLSPEDLKKLWTKVGIHGSFSNLVEKYLLSRERKDSGYGVLHTSLLNLYEKEDNIKDLSNLKIRIEKLERKTKIPADDALHYIKHKIGSLRPAPVPIWVTTEEGENLSLLTPTNFVEEKDFSYLLDDATDIFHSFTPSSSDQDTASGGGTFVKESIPLDIRETVQAYLATISGVEGDQEKMLSRIFGPPNRFEGKYNCPFNLNKRGSCRMLNCFCRGTGDSFEETELELSDINPDIWFDGTCDICLKSIRNKSHAVRYPHPMGGWIGVFCSFDCLTKSEFYNWKDDANHTIRMENLKTNLMDYGIMDRTKV